MKPPSTDIFKHFNKLWYIGILFLLSCTRSYPAQAQHSGGLRYDNPNKVEKVKLKMSAELKNNGRQQIDIAGGSTLSEADLLNAEILGAGTIPAAFTLPFPPPQDQGGEGACSAFSTCYAKDINYYFATGKTSFSTSTDIFSPEFIYNQTKFSSDCGSGSSIQIVLDFMSGTGACLWATMPFSPLNGCNNFPNATQTAEANNYRISGYTKTLARDRAALKTLIATGNPIIFGWWPDNNLVSGNGNIPAPYVWSGPRVSTGFPHASVIVGYDDNKACPDGTTGAYKVLNQWGATWEDAGCIWIGYAWFEVDPGSGFGGATVGTYVYTINGIVSTTGNISPIANAGADQTITAPTSTATLTGTATDPDGTIASYLWTQVSGPNTAGITTPATASTGLTGLVAGTYIFQLTVTDNLGLTNSATTKVIVNPASPPVNLPPIAKAGSDITLTLPNNTATLNGSGSSDPDGTISTYAWTQLAGGPNTARMATSDQAVNFISNLVSGTYQFQLLVTDNLGATASDVVVVNVNPEIPNVPPIAKAGFDQTIPSGGTVTLDGSGSYDPDGSISAYLWEYVDGPSNPSITNSTRPVSSVVLVTAGTYTYKLTVTDNNTLTAFDLVTITVDAATTESYTLTVIAGQVIKGYKQDVINWNITLTEPPQAAEVQVSALATGVNAVTLYPIANPYTAVGTYSYKLSTKKPATRYYRLRITKADGTVVLSTIKSIK